MRKLRIIGQPEETILTKYCTILKTTCTWCALVHICANTQSKLRNLAQYLSEQFRKVQVVVIFVKKELQRGADHIYEATTSPTYKMAEIELECFVSIKKRYLGDKLRRLIPHQKTRCCNTYLIMFEFAAPATLRKLLHFFDIRTT